MKIIECPRDAMQGIENFIATDKKIDYINDLLKVGFDTIDFGSFVSPEVIPQLKDTAEVLDGLDLMNTTTKLLSIVANFRGAKEACNYKNINYLGFPLSVSEQFQMRNTNKNINEAFDIIKDIQELSLKNDKELVVYISMAFGNPYNENYHPELVADLIYKLNQIEISTIALSDTIGVSEPKNIEPLFNILIKEYPNIEFGAHFHTSILNWEEKIDAAYNNGCKRFDTTIKGYGGCPMANDDLIGNMPTEKLVSYFQSKDIEIDLDLSKLSLLVENISFFNSDNL